MPPNFSEKLPAGLRIESTLFCSSSALFSATSMDRIHHARAASDNYTFISTINCRNMSTLPPYEKRQSGLDLASKEDVLKAARENSDALFVDVRTKDEVAEAPFTCCRFVHHSCTVDSTKGLEETVKPHIILYDAPVIVFCRSGRRAMKAKEVLEKMGCTHVLNAGGLGDMGYLLSKENRSHSA